MILNYIKIRASIGFILTIALFLGLAVDAQPTSAAVGTFVAPGHVLTKLVDSAAPLDPSQTMLDGLLGGSPADVPPGNRTM